jgi:PKD repeat protein
MYEKAYWLTAVFVLTALVASSLAQMPDLKLPFLPGMNWQVTNGYNPTNTSTSSHRNNGAWYDDRYALDFAAAGCDSWNQPILAMASGTVEIQQYSSSYGNHLLIDHGSGYKSRYAHLETILVVNGQWVEQGQVIGLCGHSGLSLPANGSYVCQAHPGTHIHVALYFKGVGVKPEPMSRFSSFAVGVSYNSDNYWTAPVGHYATGWNSSTSQAFVDAYNQSSTQVGFPFDNGGTPYVHFWQDQYNPGVGVWLQDYIQPDPSLWLLGSNDGQSAIILNENQNVAYLVYGVMWGGYKQTQGYRNLGYPLGDQYIDGSDTKQDFKYGILVWNGNNYSVESSVGISLIPQHIVTINSSPTGAEVWNNSILEGTTSLDFLGNENFVYEMLAKLAGYSDEKFTFTVPDRNTTINVSLTPIGGGATSGKFRFTSTPSGARLLIYGDAVVSGSVVYDGYTPTGDVVLNTGNYLAVFLTSNSQYNLYLTVVGGEDDDIHVNINNPTGKPCADYIMSSYPTGAQFEVRDAATGGLLFSGNTNMQIDFCAFAVDVTMQLANYADWDTTFQVVNGVSKIIHANLQPVTLPPPPTVNIIKNGGFEDSTISPWIFQNWPNRATLSLTTAPGEVQVGLQAVKIDVTDPGSSWQVQSRLEDLFLNSTEHSLTFWARAAAAHQITVVCEERGTWVNLGLWQPVTLTTSWQQYSFTFTPPQSSTNASLEFMLGSQAGTVWLDEVILTDGSASPPSGPTADFTASPTSGNGPLNVNFTDTSSPGTNPITAWSWDIDNDGQEDYNTQHPSHTYSTAGTYSVSLTVSGGSLSDTETKTSYISVNNPGGPVNLLTNGDFEQTLALNQSSQERWYANDITVPDYADYDPASPIGTGQGVRLDKGNQGTTLKLIQKINLTAGTTYVFEADVYNPGGFTGSGYIDNYRSGGCWCNQGLYWSSSAAQDPLTQVYKTFTPNESGYINFQFNWTNAGDDTWIDNVQVYELGSALQGFPSGYTEPNLPMAFALHQNYPNPFNPETRISFSLSEADRVTVAIYNVTGQEVARLVDERHYGAGSHTLTWLASNQPSGVYVYQIKTENGHFQRKKMILLK